MTTFIDPIALGLPPRTTIEEIDTNTLAIVINRKSRIIMTDGKKILGKAIKIKKAHPGRKVLLKTNAPLCSKTVLFLQDHGIELIRE